MTPASLSVMAHCSGVGPIAHSARKSSPTRPRSSALILSGRRKTPSGSPFGSGAALVRETVPGDVAAGAMGCAFIPESRELGTRAEGESGEVGPLPPPHGGVAPARRRGGAHLRTPGGIGEGGEVALLRRRVEAVVVRVPVQGVEAQHADTVEVGAGLAGAARAVV